MLLKNSPRLTLIDFNPQAALLYFKSYGDYDTLVPIIGKAHCATGIPVGDGISPALPVCIWEAADQDQHLSQFEIWRGQNLGNLAY